MFPAKRIFLICFCIAFAAAATPPGGYYTTRYDHIDVENILNQKRLVYYYAECLLDRGPCTPQGIEFKRILPEALRTNCLRCTEKQRFVTMKSIRRLKKEYPEVWSQLAAIWDPTGDYVKQLEDSVNKKYNRSPNPLPLASNNVNTIQNMIPTPSPEKIPNTIASKPISFSTASIPTSTSTTSQPASIATSTSTKAPFTSTSTTTNIVNNEEAPVVILGQRFGEVTEEAPIPPPITRKQIRLNEYSTQRISYNYDFAVTMRPPAQRPAGGFNFVIKGVNNIIAPITDIAGKVINVGTDIAGMVLTALGVRKV